jgi:hypothetical protein
VLLDLPDRLDDLIHVLARSDEHRLGEPHGLFAEAFWGVRLRSSADLSAAAP